MSSRAPTSGKAAELGLWTCVALVMGNMIGSGIFLLPASLAPFGGISIVGWLISAGGSLLLIEGKVSPDRLKQANGSKVEYNATS